MTDRKSQGTSTTYDGLNRPTVVTYHDTSTTTCTWDAGNRLTQIVDSVGGTITRTYDGLDRLTSETTPEGSISYTYDSNGRHASMTVAGQPTVTYAYDIADRLTSIAQGTAMVTFGYDNANRRTTLTLPNGVTTTYAYDAASRLTGLTYTLGPTTLGTLLYAYDLRGNRTVIGGTWARTGLPGALASATYNAGNHQLTFGSKALTYDLNGNLTSDGTSTYTWDSRNRLAAIAGPSPASFVYDGAGRRRSKTIGGSTTNFLHDDLNPVQEQAGSSVRNLLTGPGVDDHLLRDDGAGPSGVLGDALGSILAIVNGSGTTQATYTYDPFGATSVTGSPGSNTYTYTGREDDGTGLKYYRARYYHPELTRFISEDPIGFEGGNVNLYVYADNSPVDLIDPLGLDAWNDAANLAAGFGDTISMGGTAWVRSLWIQQFDLADVVDSSSSWNLAGRKAGNAYDALSTIIGGVGALRAIPTAVRAARGAALSLGRAGKGLATILRDQRGALGRFNANQDALIQIAKTMKNLGGVTLEEAKILRTWASEYKVSFHGPEFHSSRGYAKILHIHVGPVNYIPVR